MAVEIEKKSLEAHVELCAERYDQLDKRLEGLESRMEKIEGHVVDIKDAIEKSNNGQSKQLIAIGTTIIGVLITAIVALVIHLAQK
jgi:predicted  nucleic acid-binding Zn-ribbon protein